MANKIRVYYSPVSISILTLILLEVDGVRWISEMIPFVSLTKKIRTLLCSVTATKN